MVETVPEKSSPTGGNQPPGRAISMSLNILKTGNEKFSAFSESSLEYVSKVV